MNNEVLSNVQISESIVLAQFTSAKRFKMKPETYTATINAKQKLESQEKSEIQNKVEQKEKQIVENMEQKSNLDKKMVKLDEKNVNLKEIGLLEYNNNGFRPIRIKKAMINNIENTFNEFSIKQSQQSLEEINKKELKELLDNPSIMKVDVVNKTGISLEKVQEQQIQELMNQENNNKQVKEAIARIQREELQKLIDKKRREKEVKAAMLRIQREEIQKIIEKNRQQQEVKAAIARIQRDELQKLIDKKRKEKEVKAAIARIQREEIQKMINKNRIKEEAKTTISGLENEKQLREEIQIIPERFSGLKETIDNMFENNENVQQISREEVEETIKAGKNNTEVQESQTPNINKEEMARKIQNSIEKALIKLEEKNSEKQNNKFSLRMPTITFEDIFKCAKEQRKENNNMSDYEISESIREQIRTKLNQQQSKKHTIAFSNEEETQNSYSKIDFQSYKDKIAQRLRKNNELKELREQLQKNTAEKANKVQLAQARRQEAEAKFEEYLQRLDEQANSYNNEINEYQNQDNQYNDQINLLEEETNMLYGMLDYQE